MPGPASSVDVDVSCAWRGTHRLARGSLITGDCGSRGPCSLAIVNERGEVCEHCRVSMEVSRRKVRS